MYGQYLQFGLVQTLWFTLETFLVCSGVGFWLFSPMLVGVVSRSFSVGLKKDLMEVCFQLVSSGFEDSSGGIMFVLALPLLGNFLDLMETSALTRRSFRLGGLL